MNRDTLAEYAQFAIDVRKSRFLAHAAPTENAEDALAFLERVRSRDATHNCWAYRIGNAYRSSDDGEPSGTAGRPILAAIDGQHCDQVMVVVARWFGGIKLGAGGLVRAYGGAASECLRNATRIALIERARVEIHCGYEHVGTIHLLLAQFSAEKRVETSASDGLQFAIALPRDRLKALQIAVRDATRGQAQVTEVSE